MVGSTITRDFKYGLSIPKLKHELDSLFKDLQTFKHFNVTHKEFEGILSTEDSFPKIESTYRKLSLYLYGEKNKHGELANLKVTLQFYGIESLSKQTRKVEALIRHHVEKAVEQSKPKITFLSLQEHLPVISGTHRFKARITNFSVEKMKFFVENHLVFEGSNQTVDFMWDTTKHTDGTRNIKVMAKNDLGKQITFKKTVQIVNSPPSLVIKGIKQRDIATQTETLGLSSKGGEISTIEIEIDGNPLYSKDLSQPRKQVKQAYQWDTTNFKDGWHTITFIIKTTGGKTTDRSFKVLILNPPLEEKPVRRSMPFRKTNFYQELLETVKTLISSYYGGIFTINEATHILNRVFNFEQAITNKEIKKAMERLNDRDISLPSSNLIVIEKDRKIADTTLKSEIMQYARERGDSGFNNDEILAYIKQNAKNREEEITDRFLDVRINRCLKELKRKGKLTYQQYPPKWYFTGSSREIT